MSLYTVYPPQKDPPAPVYARAYENSAATSKSLTVANLLSPEFGNRSSSRLPSAPLLAHVYGVHGRIVDVCGKFSDPSLLAFGIESPKIWLYRVVRTYVVV